MIGNQELEDMGLNEQERQRYWQIQSDIEMQKKINPAYVEPEKQIVELKDIINQIYIIIPETPAKLTLWEKIKGVFT